MHEEIRKAPHPSFEEERRKTIFLSTGRFRE
jgi:hypothetical protein